MAHLAEHPEMTGLAGVIERALAEPEFIVQSMSDPDARLYYRLGRETSVGSKYLRAVVKQTEEDHFLLTAYLTDRLERGEILWTGNP